MKPVRALLVNTLNSGTVFWRMFNFWPAGIRTGVLDIQMPFWQKDAHEGATWQFELGDAQLKRAYLGKLSQCLREVDVCVFQMCHTRDSLNLFLSIRDAFERTGVPIVAECDDNYRNAPAYNPASTAYAPGSTSRELATRQFKMADAMVVSTPGLKDLYTDFNDHVYVVPNSIDFTVWDKASSRRRKKPGIRIGWAGGANHERDLRILERVIPAVLEKHRQARFVFVHGVPEFLKRLPGVEVVSKFVPIHHYPQFIASQDFDIGLAPLEDNDFNCGKSNLRWLEYSALGIPTVASNVGHFKQTVIDGQDGLLVDTSSAEAEAAGFIDALDHLISDRAFRTSLGARARDRVFRDFNVDNTVGTYAKVLREVAARGQVKKDERSVIAAGPAGVLTE